jgi:hypothetical protein
MRAADEADDEANEAEQQAQLQAEVEDMFELEGEQQHRHFGAAFSGFTMACRHSWLTKLEGRAT